MYSKAQPHYMHEAVTYRVPMNQQIYENNNKIITQGDKLNKIKMKRRKTNNSLIP
jgi:hypothetical protein